MIVSMFQTNPTIGDISGNISVICNAIQTKKQSHLIVFPELALQGYMPYDFFAYKQEQAIVQAIEEISSSLEPHQTVVVGIALSSECVQYLLEKYTTSTTSEVTVKTRHVYKQNLYDNFFDKEEVAEEPLNLEPDLVKPRQLINTACVINSRGLYHVQPKQELPHYDVFFETRYFPPHTHYDRASKIFEIEIDSGNGQLAQVKIGILICEDIWKPVLEKDVTNTKESSAGDSSPIAQLAKQNPDLLVCISASPFEHDKLQKRIAVSMRATKHVRVPLLYANLFGGNDEVVFDGTSFAMGSEGKLLDLRAFCRYDHADFSFDTGVLTALEARQQNLDDYAKQVSRVNSKNIVTNRYIDMSKIYRVIMLGLQDYMQKTKVARKVHLGLSGGIDSAITAALAVDALGKENVVGILLPSRYTSKASLDDANELANRLDIQTHTVSIETLKTTTMQELSEVFEQNTAETTQETSLTEENLQARLRGLMLMAYSNQQRSMLLTTGNKSEIAVGYCTLYGDMCGSLNLIGDLYKTEVYELARYINAQEEHIPQAIIDKEPTAELRENQKDSDSLPPYPVLDYLLYRFIECRESPRMLIANNVADSAIIEQVWKLYIGSEYKRKQAAPIIKLSAHAFGRGRLVPLASNFMGMR